MSNVRELRAHRPFPLYFRAFALTSFGTALRDARAMKLKFTKMNGLGNDFMVVDWPAGRPAPDAELVRRWSDRRLGVGFDQLLLLTAERPAGGDVGYRIFNFDGSEVEQCGNGVRCLAGLLAPRFGSELTLVSPAGPIEA